MKDAYEIIRPQARGQFQLKSKENGSIVLIAPDLQVAARGFGKGNIVRADVAQDGVAVSIGPS